MLIKVTVVIGCEGLKLKSTMRGFLRFNILICLFSSISSIHAKDIHNTSGGNFSAKHARNAWIWIYAGTKDWFRELGKILK